MNEFTHFFFGYLVVRIFKQKPGQFITFFTAFAAFLPDIDFIIGKIIPSVEHGVFSHTILGGLLFEFCYTVLAFIILLPLLSKLEISFGKLFLFAMLGLGAHLLLDSFTFYESIVDATHHVYFWPLWDFPVHINTMFPSATYEIRVWVEVIFSIILALVVLGYDWQYKKNNPFWMLNPKKWLEYATDSPIADKEMKQLLQRAYLFLGLIVVLLIIYIIIY